MKSKFHLLFIFFLWAFKAHAVSYTIIEKPNFWGEGIAETFIYTDHFLVSFDTGDSSKEEAIKTAEYLEKSWDVYIKQNHFKSPTHRVHTILKPNLSYNALGLAYFPTWISNAYIEMKSRMGEISSKETASHEFFHIVQYQYDTSENRWTIEATATVVEDDVFPETFGYLVFEPHWYERWDKGLDLMSQKDHFEYGGSLFFKYIMENFKGTNLKGDTVEGIPLLRSIWEYAATKSGDNTLSSISTVLGGGLEENNIYQNIFADFTAAVQIKKDVPQYSFKRGSEITGTLHPEILYNDFYYHHLSRQTGRIEAGLEYELNPLTAKYFEILLPAYKKGTLPLHLFVTGRYEHSFKVRVIGESNNKKEVLRGEKDNHSFVTRLTLPKVGGKESEEGFQKVFVAVSNPLKNKKEKFQLRYIIGDVPYLKSVRVAREDDKKIIYHGEWIAEKDSRSGVQNRKLKTQRTPVKALDTKEIRLEAELQFSEPLFAYPQIFLLQGATPLQGVSFISSRKSEDYRTWNGTLVLPLLGEDTAELTLKVMARDIKGDPLDVNPASVAELENDGSSWLRYEGDATHGAHGGADQNHKITFQHEGGKSIVLLVDASGSMKDNGKIEKAKNSAIETINNISSKDEVSLWAFFDCSYIKILQGFTHNKEPLIKALQGIQPASGTPLAEGIKLAGNYLLKEASNEEKILVVLSDGEESCNGNPVAEANALTAHNLKVQYASYFGKGTKEKGEEKEPEVVIAPEEEKDLPQEEDPVPPKEEEKEEFIPCDPQVWKSYETKEEGEKVHYYVMSYEEKETEKNCSISAQVDTYGVYYGEVVGDKDSLSWGINPQPSQTQKESADYKTQQKLFIELGKKYKDRGHYTQHETFERIDYLVKKILKK